MRLGQAVALLAIAVLVACLQPPSAFGKGDGTFQAPLTIPAGRPGPVTIHSGDFNGDGKIDLVVANGQASNVATGSPSIIVLMQSPTNRQDWTPVTIKVGTSAVFVRGADFDNDGFDDIIVGDTSKYAFFIHSKGDGTFEAPVPITGAPGARWIAVADYNNDGFLDFASSNFANQTLTVFLGDGTGKFKVSQSIPGAREHTLEALDFDGDGNMDLMQGSGLPGITPYKGQGNGKFTPKPNVSNIDCVEYISEVGVWRKGKYIHFGDFDNNGKDDLATTCIDTYKAWAAYSLGTGAYRTSLVGVQAGNGIDSTAIGDFNHDGKADVAVVDRNMTNLYIYPGKGNGTFSTPVVFGPTGTGNAFLIADDLDGDGYTDVISGEQTSLSVTVFWGKPGERFLESGTFYSGFTSVKAMGLADFDHDGQLDFFLPTSTKASVNVYLKPGQGAMTKPSFQILLTNKFTLLEAVDLNGDGVPDLLGADQALGKGLVATLDAAAKPTLELSLDAGIAPSSIEVGQIDEGSTVDFAIPCKGSNYVAIFLGHGDGNFDPAKILNTVEKPKNAALARIDDDGLMDMAVLSDTTLAVQYGTGAGNFTEPAIVVQDISKLFYDVAAGDLNGDGIMDLVVTAKQSVGVVIYMGKGSRQFADPVTFKTTGIPNVLQLGDLNGDGRLDITTSNLNQQFSVLLNKDDGTFGPAVGYGAGFSPLGHRIVDLNLDGTPDLVGFMASSAILLLGRPVVELGDGSFRRGDVSADGQIQVNDPIQILDRLFLAGPELPCERAADADDDGQIAVNDPILILNRLFLGGDPLPPPGPEACGQEVNPKAGDTLTCTAPCH